MKDNVIQEFMESIKTDPEKKQQVYSAIVSRIDPEGTVWVFVAGSNKETPTASTSASVKSGDVVNVMWQNNKLYIAGNYTDPSSGITKVRQVEQAANTAREAANNAVADAGRARAAAEEAEITANSVRGIAVDAQTNAGIAKTAADNAMKGLGQVEDVVGTLNWITEHSKVTEDTTPQAGKSYYIKNQDNTFTLVTDVEGKNPAQEGWYELTEAVQNYILSHLALTNTGLYVMADDSHWKVRIADDGVYIIDGTSGQDKVVAKYKDSITLGMDDGSQSFFLADYHSLRLLDKEQREYVFLSDLRDLDEYVTMRFIGDGETQEFDCSILMEKDSEIKVKVDGVQVFPMIIVAGQEEYQKVSIVFDEPPLDNSVIEIYYKVLNKRLCKAFTLGTRKNGSDIGLLSFAFGYEILAKYDGQVCVGSYNDNKSNSCFEIGNGTNHNNRSNAFTVNWNGNTNSWSKDFERDTGGDLNEGFRIVDKNGDVVAYMKGLSTLDSQDRTVEGFNIGTSRTVNGSDKWNSLRMMIDADGNPVVALNQVDAWLKAFGLYEPTTPTISISATTGTVASYTVKKYGKVVSLTLRLQKSSATNAGSNFFAGTINTTGLRPLDYATSAGYYGSNSFVGNISSAGNITVRHTGTSQQAAVTGSTYVILGFTYLVK